VLGLGGLLVKNTDKGETRVEYKNSGLDEAPKPLLFLYIVGNSLITFSFARKISAIQKHHKSN
tara:strand:+ start:2474 stop:2662 length:189 start_codon:yes stop_codon:yes gene_type:complete